MSLAAEYETEPKVPIRFVGFSRNAKGIVTVQTADTLPELRDNAILAEFAAHYDREQHLFALQNKI